MKNTLFLFAFGLMVSMNVVGQSKATPKATISDSIRVSELVPNLEITIGYAQKSGINALKSSLSVNKVLFKSIGFYTSFEKGLDSDYFTNIYGLTGSVLPKIYVWGGIGLFGTSGFFINDQGLRKELGVGFNPAKRDVMRLGWSSTIGLTISVGLQLPCKI